MTIAFLVFVAPFAGCVTLMHGYDRSSQQSDIGMHSSAFSTILALQRWILLLQSKFWFDCTQCV